MVSRKTKRANIEKTVPFFFRIGLVVSIALAIVAFEWKTPYSENLVVCHFDDWDIEEEEIIIVTKRNVPNEETPKPEPLEKKVVENKLEPIPQPRLEPKKIELTPETRLQPIKKREESLVKDSFVPFPEIGPRYPGGDQAYLAYLKDNIKYPRMAIKEGIEGKVYIEFILNSRGEIINAIIKKDIGGGCGMEALRVIKIMPNWIPAKQGIREVATRMVVPVNFILQN